MPHRRAALRVKRIDAERLHARTVEMTALTIERMMDTQQRAVATALLIQQSRACIRRSMWLSHSA